MNQAEQRQALLWADRKRMISLLESRPEINDALDALKHQSRLGSLPVAEALQKNVQQYLDVVLSTVRDMEAYRDLHLDAIRIFLYESDAVTATSQKFDDDSCLIRVADGLLSLCRHLCDVNQLWLGSNTFSRALNIWKHISRLKKGIDTTTNNEAVWAGAAAIRYYVLHQRMWGSSAIIGSKFGSLDNTTESLAEMAFMFIVAHEVGHFALDHSPRNRCLGDDETAVHELEHEADAFAFSIIASLGPDRNRAGGMASLAAFLGLLAVSLGEGTLYLRAPESHPTFASRWSRLVSGTKADAAVWSAYAGVFRMVEEASDIRHHLDDKYWESLYSSRLETDIHDAGYYKLVRGMDMSLDYSDERYQELLKKFVQDGSADLRPGLELIDNGKLLEGLYRWKVKKADKIADTARPLSYHALLNAVVDSPLWDSASSKYQGSDMFRRSVAMLCINQVGRRFSGE